MKCSRCDSDRFLEVRAKCADRFSMNYMENTFSDNYPPADINIGGGDYVCIELCMECGHVRGDWPVSDEKLARAFGGPVYCDKCCEDFAWPSELSKCRRCGKNLCEKCGGQPYDDYCKKCREETQPAAW